MTGGPDGEVFETGDAGGPPAAAAPARRPLAIAGVLLVSGALIAAVVALRPPTPPTLPDANTATGPPASAPAEPALGWAGFGDVLLDMPAADFRDGHRDLSGWDSTVRVPGRDTERGCIQYQIASRTGPTVCVGP